MWSRDVDWDLHANFGVGHKLQNEDERVVRIHSTPKSEGFAMLLSYLIQLVDTCVSERQVLSGFSPAQCIFRRNALHAGGRLRLGCATG